VNQPSATIALGGLFAIVSLVFSGSASAEDKKEIGQRLLDNAQKLSDIRAEGSHAFRMEVKFRITSKSPAKETEGKYAEIWVSKVKWHREVETPSFHRLEVGLSPYSSSYLDSGSDQPDTLSDRMLLRFPQSSPEIRDVSEGEVSGVKTTCVESKELGAKNLDCVDPSTGVFLLREIHYHGSGVETCSYRDYQKFRELMFPRSVHCVKKPGDEIELTIATLAAETAPDESLFAKPPGAVEIGHCPSRVTPPKLTYNPEPKYPAHGQENVTAVLSTVVGVEGKPGDLRVTNSAGKDFDQSALDAVRLWTFKPAICEGVPIPVLISVQVNFHKR